MAEKLPIFTVDLEAWNHALHQDAHGRWSTESCNFLFDILKKYEVKALFYVLGRFRDEYTNLATRVILDGHTWGWHGQHHDHYDPGLDEPHVPYRSPYWDYTPMPCPPSGGFFFRLMPLWYIKWALKKSGIFWIHPHDLDEGHPKIKGPFLNWKRHVGLKTARAKLDRLLSEVKFDNPTQGA